MPGGAVTLAVGAAVLAVLALVPARPRLAARAPRWPPLVALGGGGRGGRRRAGARSAVGPAGRRRRRRRRRREPAVACAEPSPGGAGPRRSGCWRRASCSPPSSPPASPPDAHWTGPRSRGHHWPRWRRRSAWAPTCPRRSVGSPPSRAVATCGWSRRRGRSPTAPARVWDRPSTRWPTGCGAPRPADGSSRASWPRRGPRPGSWVASRCSPWRWASAPAATRGASCFGHPAGLACLAGGLAFGLAGLAWIEAIARDVDRDG